MMPLVTGNSQKGFLAGEEYNKEEPQPVESLGC